LQQFHSRSIASFSIFSSSIPGSCSLGSPLWGPLPFLLFLPLLASLAILEFHEIPQFSPLKLSLAPISAQWVPLSLC
jgi:hypothetical protein